MVAIAISDCLMHCLPIFGKKFQQSLKSDAVFFIKPWVSDLYHDSDFR